LVLRGREAIGRPRSTRQLRDEVARRRRIQQQAQAALDHAEDVPWHTAVSALREPMREMARRIQNEASSLLDRVIEHTAHAIDPASGAVAAPARLDRREDIGTWATMDAKQVLAAMVRVSQDKKELVRALPLSDRVAVARAILTALGVTLDHLQPIAGIIRR
jgi:hypothetical protein